MMSPIATALILAAVAGAVEGASGPPSRLPVLVTETPGSVRLRIQLPEDVEPGSVEVQLAGSEIAVVARNASGEQIRSESHRLTEPAVEDGAEADWESDGSMTITLPTARPGK
jgi:hypothetical protein